MSEMKLTKDDRSGVSDNQLAELAKVYKDIPVGLCFIDRDFRYLLINDWHAALNGTSADDHIGGLLAMYFQMLQQASKCNSDLSWKQGNR
jgi:hypothetical protein